MIDNYTSEQIIKAAKCCLCKIKCDNCPLVVDVRCSDVFAEYILKNEPAPAATGTSSEVVSKDTDNIHLDDSTQLDICQEGLDEISKIALGDYPNEFLTGYACAVRDNIKRLKGAN